MIGFGRNSVAGVWMVWLGYVHGWCVCMVDAIDVHRLLSVIRRGVSEV